MSTQGNAKPLIAVDFDDVLMPFVRELAAYHNEKYDTALAVDAYLHFYFEQIWGGTREEASAKVVEFFQSGRATMSEALPGSEEALQELSELFEFAILTSRPSAYERETLEWANGRFPGRFREIRFANYWDTSRPRLTKIEVCKDLGAVALVDDHGDYVLEAARSGLPAVLFGFYPWNRQLETHTLIRRAADWSEVPRALEGLGLIPG